MSISRELQASREGTMGNNGHSLPPSPVELAKRLNDLHEERRKQYEEHKSDTQKRRRTLTKREREDVLEKTNGHCHLCGGVLNKSADGELPQERETVFDRIKPVFDHIVPRAVGGSDDPSNFLAAHGLCNGSRWFYSPEEFQWILRIGVWARKQMEDETPIGKKMCEPFLKNEEKVLERRKPRYEE